MKKDEAFASSFLSTNICILFGKTFNFLARVWDFCVFYSFDRFLAPSCGIHA